MSKILPTIGPISSSKNSIKRILKYCSFLRINGSHNSIEWHAKISNRIKKLNKNAKILLDIPGVKPRVNLKDEIIIYNKDKCCFYFGKKPKLNGINYFIELTNPLPKNRTKNKNFTLADGNFNFKLISRSKNFIIGSSNQNFKLEDKKGLNIPQSIYSDNLQNKKYLNFLKKTKKIEYDAIGLSFVQNSRIVKKIRTNYPKKIIVSKIENLEGLNNASEIIKESDLIMIDRGDLGAEIGDNDLYKAIIKITGEAKREGKIVIMATENLQSMINGFSPNKNELISLEFSLSLHSDFIMLSEETAISKRYYYIIKWLNNFLLKKNVKNTLKNEIYDFWENIKIYDKSNVIIFTKKGYAIQKIRQANFFAELTVFTDNPKIHSLSQLRPKTSSFLTKKFINKNLLNFIYKNIKRHKNQIFKKFNTALLIYVSFPRGGARANTVTLINKNDF